MGRPAGEQIEQKQWLGMLYSTWSWRGHDSIACSSRGVLLARHLGAPRRSHSTIAARSSLAFVAALNSNPAVVCGGEGCLEETRREEGRSRDGHSLPRAMVTDQVVCSCLMPHHHASCSWCQCFRTLLLAHQTPLVLMMEQVREWNRDASANTCTWPSAWRHWGPDRQRKGHAEHCRCGLRLTDPGSPSCPSQQAFSVCRSLHPPRGLMAADSVR